MPSSDAKTPISCARSRGSSNTLRTIDIATGLSIAPPIAWSTRKATSSSRLGASAHSSDPSENEHAGQPATAEYFEGIVRGADTIALGRTNYEGFYSVWPAMTRDQATDPRTRDLGRWLDATEKVVISRTLTDAPWENSRITGDLPGEIKRLRQAPGCDVLVINSASVIGELLRLDLVDDLYERE